MTNVSPFRKHRYGKLNTLLNGTWVFLLIVAIFRVNDHLRGHDKSDARSTDVIKESLCLPSLWYSEYPMQVHFF